MKQGVILIGMMGVGKSAVGKLLSSRLGLSFVETDQLIEERGKSVSELFQIGEEHFRKIERSVCRALSQSLRGEQNDPLVIARSVATKQSVVGKSEIASPLARNDMCYVIATGGGVPVDPVCWESVKTLGMTVYLKATPKSLCQRIKDKSSRPLLAGAQTEEEIERVLGDLLSVREPYYNSAETIIETDRLTAEKVCDQILERLECENI
ncbi:shikimate kinase [Bdellovibrionota bacterium]